MSKKIRIEMWRSTVDKLWRFKLISGNHKILCDSEAYSAKNKCRKTAELIKRSKMVVVEK